MAITLSTPRADDLGRVLDALREWQRDGVPVQLHPGDLGWHWRLGAEATAAVVRTWDRDGRILAAGLVDGPQLVRLAVAPDAGDDEEVAAQLVDDLSDPLRGVLGAGDVDVEVRFGAAVRRRLTDAGWTDGEPWTPLCRDLSEPVEDCGVRIEVIGPQRAAARAAVQRAAFASSSFTELRWQVMAAGPAYADARCLIAVDEADVPVAAVTVWSAGPGRPGLLEPMGVHPEHRGRGYGRAITVAAAAALRELGSSSATVCTMSANTGGVVTYASAGFEQLPDVRDLHATSRPAAAPTPGTP